MLGTVVVHFQLALEQLAVLELQLKMGEGILPTVHICEKFLMGVPLETMIVS
jgi:hypothetical protein